MASETRSKTPLFVRLPSEQAASLDDASRRLQLTKGLIVAQAISNYLAQLDAPVGDDVVDAATRFVNARSPEPLVPRPPTGIDALLGAPVGRHSFTPSQQLEVLTLDQLAHLLHIPVDDVRRLAEKREIPGRKLGADWRFSRAAVLAWLAGE